MSQNSALDTLEQINKLIPKLQRKTVDPSINKIIFNKTIEENNDEEEEIIQIITEESDDEENQDNDQTKKKQVIVQNLLDQIDVDQILDKTKLDETKTNLSQNALNKSKILQNQSKKYGNSFKFPLTLYQPKYSEEHLQFLQFHYISQLNEPLFNTQAKQLNKIRCISINSKKVAAAGNLGNVLVLDKETNSQQLFRTGGNFGVITTLDIFKNLMIIGFEHGQLSFINVKANEYMLNDSIIHKNKLLAAKIIYQDQSKTLIISSDQSGLIIQSKFYKKMFGHKVQGQPILPKQDLPFQHIEVLSEELDTKFMKRLKEKEIIIGIGNTAKIMIYGISPKDEQQYAYFSIKNPSFSLISQKDFFSSLCWGQGYIQQDKKTKQSLVKEEYPHLKIPSQEEIITQEQETETKVQTQIMELLLVYTWNDQLFMVKPNWKKDEYTIEQTVHHEFKLEFEDSKAIKAENNIILTGFVAPGIICCIDIHQNVQLFNTFDCRSFIKVSEMKNLPKLKYDIPLQNVIFCQLFEVESQDKKNKSKISMSEDFGEIDEELQRMLMQKVKRVQLFKNSFATLTQNNEIYYLCENQLGIIKLNNWRTLVDRMIDHGEWILAMHFLISIFQNNNKFINILGLSQQNLGEVIEECVKMITTRYVQMSIKMIQMNGKEEFKINIIVIIIEFLLKTGQTIYLFNEIKNIITASFGKVDYFMESLEPFIRQKRIRKIPSNVILKEIIQYYMDRNQLHIIQSLIISLELNAQNIQEFSSYLIQISLDNGLMKALIYICTKEQNEEFMAPLSKLWGLYLNHKYNNRKYEAEYFGLRTLWYVRLCLKRQTIDGGFIDGTSDKFKGIVQQLAEWTFYENNLKQMIQLSIQAAFEVIILFFEHDNSQILNQIDNLVIAYDEKKIPDWVKTTERKKCDEALLLIIKCYEDLLTYPSELPNFQELLINEFNLFIARLALSGGFEIQNHKIIETIKFLLKNPNSLKTLQFNEERIKYQNWPNQDEVQECVHSKFIDNLLKRAELQWSEEEKINIAEEADKSKFVEIQIVMWAKKKEYKKCLDLFIKSKNKLVKEKVFSWLRQLMAEFECGEQFNLLRTLKDIINNRLKDLLKIHIEYTRDLISRFFKQEETVIVMQLSDYKEIQLEYIENILKDREDQKQIDNQILIRHIELLCILKPKQIKPELMEWQYPQEECLQLCKKYKVMDAATYLLERSGQYTQAIEGHQQILEKAVDKYLLYINNKDYQQQKLEKMFPKKESQQNSMNDVEEVEVQVEIQSSESLENKNEALMTESQKLYELEKSRIKEEEDAIRKNFLNSQMAVTLENDFVSSQNDLDKKQNSDSFNDYDPNYTNQDPYLKKQDQKILNYVQLAIQTCKIQTKHDEQNSEEIWFKYFDYVLDLQAKKLQKKTEDLRPLMNLCKKITGILIYEISQGIDIDKLIRAFEGKYSKLDLGELKATFFGILADHSHSENILDNSNDLLRADLIDFTNINYDKNQKGVFVNPICDKCSKSVDQNKNNWYAYRCGHLFCSDCYIPCPNTVSNTSDIIKMGCQACNQRETNIYWNISTIGKWKKKDPKTEKKTGARDLVQLINDSKNSNQSHNRLQDSQIKSNQKLSSKEVFVKENKAFTMTIGRDTQKYKKEQKSYNNALQFAIFDQKKQGKYTYQSYIRPANF